VPFGRDGSGDCPGSALNDDGTLATFVTIGQECPDEQAEIATTKDPCRERVVEGAVDVEANVVVAPTGLLTTEQSLLRPAAMTASPRAPVVDFQKRLMSMPISDTPNQPGCNTEYLPTMEGVSTASSASFATSEPIRIVVVIDEFGRDTCIVDEVCQMIKDMPRPWSAYRVFEAATARFPNIDRATLRMTVLAVLMGQRRCAIKMTTAGINSACADAYRNSF